MTTAQSVQKDAMARHLKSPFTHEHRDGDQSIVDLVLEKGTWFFDRAQSAQYPTARKWKRHNKPGMKQCFFNAQLFCMDEPSARYFEGFALSSANPFHHGWVLMPDGRLVDFTLGAAEHWDRRENTAFKDEQTIYVGVEVPTSFIKEVARKTGHLQPIAGHYFLQWPVTEVAIDYEDYDEDQ